MVGLFLLIIESTTIFCYLSFAEISTFRFPKQLYRMYTRQPNLQVAISLHYIFSH